MTVGDGERWWYRDPRFGVEPLDEQLVHVELPELKLFDPWDLASDLTLQAAPGTICAGREALAAIALCLNPTSLLLAGAERYEIAVDSERGVILKLAALFGDEPAQVHEILDISFDEDLDPGLFELEGATEQAQDTDVGGRPAEKQLQCSFCGKSQRQVMKLIAGPGIYICDECISLCNEIIDEELRIRGQ